MSSQKPSAADLVNKSAATPASPSARSGETVTVGCKVPNGMILRVFETVLVRVPAGGGTMIEEPQAREIGRHVVNGPKWPVNQPMPEYMIVGNAGITNGVPADFWAKWLEQNAEHDAVINKMIFAMPTQDGAVDFAKERAEQRSGAEPLKQEGDERRPRPLNRNLSDVGKDGDKKAA